jgi:predicted metalloprotease with PDZ domain
MMARSLRLLCLCAIAIVTAAQSAGEYKLVTFEDGALGIDILGKEYQFSVTAVVPGSQADMQGVEVGDTIVGLDGVPLDAMIVSIFASASLL